MKQNDPAKRPGRITRHDPAEPVMLHRGIHRHVKKQFILEKKQSFFKEKKIFIEKLVFTIKIHFKYMFNLFLLGCEFVFKGGAPGPINNFVKTSFFHHFENKLAQFTPRPPRPQFENRNGVNLQNIETK